MQGVTRGVLSGTCLLSSLIQGLTCTCVQSLVPLLKAVTGVQLWSCYRSPDIVVTHGHHARQQCLALHDLALHDLGNTVSLFLQYVLFK